MPCVTIYDIKTVCNASGTSGIHFGWPLVLRGTKQKVDIALPDSGSILLAFLWLNGGDLDSDGVGGRTQKYP